VCVCVCFAVCCKKIVPDVYLRVLCVSVLCMCVCLCLCLCVCCCVLREDCSSCVCCLFVCVCKFVMCVCVYVLLCAAGRSFLMCSCVSCV